MGNMVPQSTENAIPTSSRLLNRKLASRETMLSRCDSASSMGSRFQITHAVATMMKIR
jgi:hypothetical protein